MTRTILSRRSFASGLLVGSAALLSGCQTTRRVDGDAAEVAEPAKPKLLSFIDSRPLPDGNWPLMYGPQDDPRFDLPPIPWEKVDERYRRQVVPNLTGKPEGSLVVDVKDHFLYWTSPGGKAVRSGVGLGREGDL